MFKKEFKISKESRLKSSELKRIRSTILTCFSSSFGYSVTDDDLDLLGLVKNRDVRLAKHSAHCSILSVDAVPIFFDLEDREDWVPTVFALWMRPRLLPTLWIFAPVSQFILGGADPMLPGVAVPVVPGAEGNLDRFLRHQKRSVKVCGNPFSIAVGLMETSSGELDNFGMKGKALKVQHLFSDALAPHSGTLATWIRTNLDAFANPSPSPSPAPVPAPNQPPTTNSVIFSGADFIGAECDPNDAGIPVVLRATVDRRGTPPGFHGRRVDPCVPRWTTLFRVQDGMDGEGDVENGSDDNDGAGGEDGEDGNGNGERERERFGYTLAEDRGGADGGVAESWEETLIETPIGSNSASASHSASTTSGNELADSVAKSVNLKDDGEDGNDDGDDHSGPSSTSGPNSLELELDKAFLRSLVEIKDKDLPVPASQFFKNYILAYRTPGIDLDLKKTKYKKLSKFLTEMQKAKLITMKDVKGSTDPVLHAVDRKNPRYLQAKSEARDSSQSTATASSSSSASSPAAVPESPDSIHVTTVYTVSERLLPIIHVFHPDAEKSFQLTHAEAIRCLREYLRVSGLFHVHAVTGESYIAMNELLIKEILGKSKPADYKATWQEVQEKFFNRLHMFQAIEKDDTVTVVKGSLNKIYVRLEARMGGKKFVTHIGNVEQFQLLPTDLAQEFAKTFAASSTIQKIPGKSGLHEIMVQGNVYKEIAAIFLEKYKIPKDLMIVENVSKPKKPAK